MVAFYRDIIGLDLLTDLGAFDPGQSNPGANDPGANDPSTTDRGTSDPGADTAAALPDIVFFRISAGYGGHTCVLALFAPGAGRPGLHPQDQDLPQTGAGSSLHHLALTVAYDEQDAAMRWYDQHGLAYRVEHFGWIGWRGVFTNDPDGNTVELVAHHPSL